MAPLNLLLIKHLLLLRSLACRLGNGVEVRDRGEGGYLVLSGRRVCRGLDGVDRLIISGGKIVGKARPVRRDRIEARHWAKVGGFAAAAAVVNGPLTVRCFLGGRGNVPGA